MAVGVRFHIVGVGVYLSALLGSLLGMLQGSAGGTQLSSGDGTLLISDVGDCRLFDGAAETDGLSQGNVLGLNTYQPGTDHLPVQCWLLLGSVGGMVDGLDLLCCLVRCCGGVAA